MHSNIQNKCNSDNHLITDLKRKKKNKRTMEVLYRFYETGTILAIL